MSKKAEYKNAVRSRRMIRQAFIELMKEKELEKVTVTEIITRADLNRGTFYAHYQDTRAVIEEFENEIINKMLAFLGEVHYGHFFQNPLPLLLEVANYLESDLEFFRILINAKDSEQFLAKLKSIFVSYMVTDSDIPDSFKTTTEFIIQSHFFAGGIANLYQKWFKGELTCSLSELSLTVSKIIKSNSDSYFNNYDLR